MMIKTKQKQNSLFLSSTYLRENLHIRIDIGLNLHIRNWQNFPPWLYCFSYSHRTNFLLSFSTCLPTLDINILKNSSHTSGPVVTFTHCFNLPLKPVILNNFSNVCWSFLSLFRQIVFSYSLTQFQSEICLFSFSFFLALSHGM